MTAQRGVEIRIVGERGGAERRLLGERRMAVLAGERVTRRAREQLGQLSGHPGSHRACVNARAPVGELRRMTGPA